MAGNWKMNQDHNQAVYTVQKLDWLLKDAKHDYGRVEVCVVVPFTNIRSVATLIDADKMSVSVGAQDVSQHEQGAYTGEVSAQMLARLGVRYVVVGHSERREYHAETDALVAAKAQAVLSKSMRPIVCVGEGLDVRKAGEHVSYTLTQLDGSLAGIPAEQIPEVVIAYEPVWAIGTGEVATPEDAQEVCAAIRERIGQVYGADCAQQIRILYGGSVKSGNVAAIMLEEDVDGALVGGASLDPEEFARIVRYEAHQIG